MDKILMIISGITMIIANISLIVFIKDQLEKNRIRKNMCVAMFKEREQK